MDGIYLHMPEWTARNEEITREARSGLGIMQEPSLFDVSMDDFLGVTYEKRKERNRRKRQRRTRTR